MLSAVPLTTTEPVATTTVCEAVYEEEEGTGARGGEKQDGLTTLEDCKAACTPDAECFAFDYVEGQGCWFHTSEDYESRKYSRPTVTLYVKKPCPSPGRKLKQYIMFKPCIENVMTFFHSLKILRSHFISYIFYSKNCIWQFTMSSHMHSLSRILCFCLPLRTLCNFPMAVKQYIPSLHFQIIIKQIRSEFCKES